MYKEQAREAASFKTWVADQLKIEFGKINDNFVGAAIALDGKEKRLQDQISQLRELEPEMHEIKIQIKGLAESKGNGQGASKEIMEELNRALKKQSNEIAHQ